MGTACTIAIKNKNEKVKSIFCKWDGYVEHTGVMLLKYYNSEGKVNDLISLGYLSILMPKIESENEYDESSYFPNESKIKHTFSNPQKDVTIAYHRDRGEPLIVDEYESENQWLRDEFEYHYIWKNNLWYVNNEVLSEILTLEVI